MGVPWVYSLCSLGLLLRDCMRSHVESRSHFLVFLCVCTCCFRLTHTSGAFMFASEMDAQSGRAGWAVVASHTVSGPFSTNEICSRSLMQCLIDDGVSNLPSLQLQSGSRHQQGAIEGTLSGPDAAVLERLQCAEVGAVSNKHAFAM